MCVFCMFSTFQMCPYVIIFLMSLYSIFIFISMGKQFNQNNNRGGGGNRGGNRGGGRGAPRGGRGGRQFDQGPPSFVVPYGTYMHRSENCFVVKCTDPTRVPKFNRGVYLESKAKVGSVDQILGPATSFYFSVKPAQGVNADGFKPGQVLFMNPEDLLGIDRFTKKQPAPKGPKPAGFGGKPGGRPGGNFGGKPGGNFGGRPGGNFGGNRPGGNFGKSNNSRPIQKK